MSAIPVTWNIDLTRTDSSVQYFEATTGSDEEPLDLALFDDIVMEIREGESHTTRHIATLKLGEGITITGEDNNGLLIDLSSQITQLFRYKISYHALRFVYAGQNAIETWATGRIRTTFIPSNQTV